MFKHLLKSVSGTLRFDPYCLSKELIQISAESSYFFGVQKFIQKIVSGTIWFDPYCPYYPYWLAVREGYRSNDNRLRIGEERIVCHSDRQYLHINIGYYLQSLTF